MYHSDHDYTASEARADEMEGEFMTHYRLYVVEPIYSRILSGDGREGDEPYLAVLRDEGNDALWESIEEDDDLKADAREAFYRKLQEDTPCCRDFHCPCGG